MSDKNNPQYEECPLCKQQIRITRQGYFRVHYAAQKGGWFNYRASVKCQGGGTPGTVRQVMES